MSFTLRSWLTAAAATLLVAGPAAQAAALTPSQAQAQARVGAALARSAQAITPQQLTQMPAGIRQAFLKARMAQQKAAAATNDGLDHVPPTLTAIQTSPPVNTAGDNFMAKFKLQLADSFSGVASACVTVSSPGGIYYGTCHSSLPSHNLSANLGLELGSVEPGTWSVVEVDVWDAAGNWAGYYGDSLAPFGNLNFEVKSPRWYGNDSVAPTISLGTVLTPTLSLSSHAKGTNNAPYAAVTLSVADQGSPTASGIRSAGAYFCTPDTWYCLYTSADDSVYRHGSEDLKAFTQLPTWYLIPGDYQLYYAWVVDFHGNSTYYTSTFFGGETDMSTLFPAGSTITLTP